jgi:hypothetical protein
MGCLVASLLLEYLPEGGDYAGRTVNCPLIVVGWNVQP